MQRSYLIYSIVRQGFSLNLVLKCVRSF